MKKLMTLLAATMVLVAATGCEPKMTIAAHNSTPGVRCGEVLDVVVSVEPAGATPKVVLQRTKGGKWVDVSGWQSRGVWAHGLNAPGQLWASPSKSGDFTIHQFVTWMGTVHLRVRSDGKSAVSGSFYVNVTEVDGDC